jgi:hypothetical protein
LSNIDSAEKPPAFQELAKNAPLITNDLHVDEMTKMGFFSRIEYLDTTPLPFHESLRTKRSIKPNIRPNNPATTKP